MSTFLLRIWGIHDEIQRLENIFSLSLSILLSLFFVWCWSLVKLGQVRLQVAEQQTKNIPLLEWRNSESICAPLFDFIRAYIYSRVSSPWTKNIISATFSFLPSKFRIPFSWHGHHLLWNTSTLPLSNQSFVCLFVLLVYIIMTHKVRTKKTINEAG